MQFDDLCPIVAGFWHGSLYHAKWASRKYRPDLAPSSGNLAHNLWYTSLGTAQYTVPLPPPPARAKALVYYHSTRVQASMLKDMHI